MSYLRTVITPNNRYVRSCFKNISVLKNSNVRHYCENIPKMTTEKSVNHVTLLGRVGINPQLRGTESKPVVVFTLATNTNYKYESGEINQKTDWHRVTVFKPHLRELVLEYLKKGARIYLEGRIMYGEFSDSKGVSHNTTTIIASDIVFVGGAEKKTNEVDSVDVENAVL